MPFDQLRRRDFITLLGGAAATWPLVARAQQPTVPVIGFLHFGAPETSGSSLTAFREGLSESGFIERRNVAIEYRWARNDVNRLPELAADLAHLQVSVMATISATASLAAKAATTTIPIVFSSGADPVTFGLVSSLNHPGANITGVSSISRGSGLKRFGILHELL